MSEKNVSVEQVLNMAREAGCEVTEQKAWWKVTAGQTKKALYVGKHKRGFSEMHVSGFTPSDHPAIEKLDETKAKAMRLGKVRGVLSSRNLDENVDTLSAFQVALESLLQESQNTEEVTADDSEIEVLGE